MNYHNGYKLIAKNQTIPVAELKNSCLQDPLAKANGIKIHKDILTLEFSYFMSYGGWEWPRHTYTFRWQNNQLQLISFNYNRFYRNSDEMSNKSYNFSTMKLKKYCKR